MVQPYITQLMAEEHIREMRHDAAHRRLAAAATPATPAPAAHASLWRRFREFIDRGQLGPGYAHCAPGRCAI